MQMHQWNGLSESLLCFKVSTETEAIEKNIEKMITETEVQVQIDARRKI